MSFPMLTSVKPPTSSDELSYLRDCLNSWRRAGFDTIAVNGPAEANALQTLGLPVEFSVMAADRRPRINDFVSVIRTSGRRFAGIINSDCIIGYPGIADNLRAGLEGRIVLAWRADVDGTEAKAMRWGFDAFFFDTTVMPSDDCGFSIGDTWWDHWFPMACEVNGATIETLDIPLLVHRAHPPNWNWDNWESNGRRFWEWLGKPGTPSKSDLHALAASVPAQRHMKRHTICVTGSSETETALRLAGRLMIEDATQSRAELLRLRGKAEAEVRQLRAEVAAMRDSTSWRITAPLRAISTVAKSFAKSFPGGVLFKGAQTGPKTAK